MTFEDLAYLKTPEARHLIAENEKTDPSVLALKYRIPALATQLKYWQRSRLKLPSLYAAQAIIPPLAFEQCSSELAASAKEASGKRCLDLTCGLGIDTLHFSNYFDEVIAVEQNEVLAEVVRYNLDLMNVKNVEIKTETAENYIKNYSGEPFDLIFIDPARRDDAGKKVFLPEDCSPNIVELLPFLEKIGHKIMVKMSPMYDVDAAVRQFPNLERVVILSLNNECKEVILEFGGLQSTALTQPLIYAKANKNNDFIEIKRVGKVMGLAQHAERYKYIIEPDVAFYKGRMLTDFYKHFFDSECMHLTDANGFFVSDNLNIYPSLCRIFKIWVQMDYHPRQLKTRLKSLWAAHGYINVIQRNFPFSTEEIRKSLNVKEGGDYFLICTLVNGKKVAWIAERIQ